MKIFLKTLLFFALLFISITLIGSLSILIGAMIGLMLLFTLCILIITNMDGIIARIYKTHPAVEGELSIIYEKTLMLSKRANIAMPSIYFTELPLPGSFVIGKSPDKTMLIVPTRLLNLLDDKELEALLAYNIVQINNTIYLRTLIALITGLLTMIASAIRWGAVFTGFGDYNDTAPKLFGFFIMGLVAPPAALMINSLIKIDYDAKAAKLCGNPYSLISAIESLKNNNVTGYPSLGFLCLIDPQKENFFEYLFNMHTSKEIRIKNLTE